jgi:hypothetical protein
MSDHGEHDWDSVNKYAPFRVPLIITPRAAEQMQELANTLRRQEKERQVKEKAR